MCLFCDIAAGTVAAHFVYEDETSVAFLDHRPLFPGHSLLITRTHIETFADLPAELVPAFFAAAQRLALAVESAMEAQGTFVAMNNKVSQSVPHLHVHIVPRRRKDGLRGFFWPRTKYAGDTEMADTAARVRRALQ
jgi:histidine triad (HIT) family protein